MHFELLFSPSTHYCTERCFDVQVGFSFTHPQQVTCVEKLRSQIVVKVIPDKQKDVDGHPNALKTHQENPPFPLEFAHTRAPVCKMWR